MTSVWKLLGSSIYASWRTMLQFIWQDDLISVAKSIGEGLDPMLGADSADGSQPSDQTQVASQRWHRCNHSLSRSLQGFTKRGMD